MHTVDNDGQVPYDIDALREKRPFKGPRLHDDGFLPNRVSFVGHKGHGKDTAASTLDDLGYTNVKFAGALKAMLAAALRHLRFNDGAVQAMIEGDLKEEVISELNPWAFSNLELLEVMLDTLIEYQGVDPGHIQTVIKADRGWPRPELAGLSYTAAIGSLRYKWLEAAWPDGNGCTTPRWLMQTLGTEWGRKCVAEDFWIRITLKRISLFKKVVVTDCRFMNEAIALRGADFFIIRVNRPDAPVDLSHQSEREIAMIPEDVTITNDGSLADLFAKTKDTLYRR